MAASSRALPLFSSHKIGGSAHLRELKRPNDFVSGSKGSASREPAKAVAVWAARRPCDHTLAHITFFPPHGPFPARRPIRMPSCSARVLNGAARVRVRVVELLSEAEGEAEGADAQLDPAVVVESEYPTTCTSQVVRESKVQREEEGIDSGAPLATLVTGSDWPRLSSRRRPPPGTHLTPLRPAPPLPLPAPSPKPHSALPSSRSSPSCARRPRLLLPHARERVRAAQAHLAAKPRRKRAPDGAGGERCRAQETCPADNSISFSMTPAPSPARGAAALTRPVSAWSEVERERFVLDLC